MPRLPNLVHRSMASARRLSPTAAASFASGVTQKALMFFLLFLVLTLMQHGKGALKRWLIRQRD